MSEPKNTLSVVFIWHMHQPEYKDNLTGEYLMPWVRLHAIKDYLDMVVILQKYPRIRQTFNLVPSLIDQILDYTKPETMDLHMKVMLKDTFSEDDKRFIFQRFFDAPADTMIARSPYYFSLLERRNQAWEFGEPRTSVFSDQEFADITALFNLVWFDPMWLEEDNVLKALWRKQQHYTVEDRRQILEIQRALIQKVLPTYQKFQDRKQIEITTTPFYHPILPLLINAESARVAMPNAVMPEETFQYPEDALAQVVMAKEHYQKHFKTQPYGIWPSEQSISPQAIRMMKDEGFHWAVSSEANLSLSLGVPLEKDPYGNVLNVEVLCRPYQYEGMNLIFRNLTLSDLIGFHYATFSPQQAAHDFYQRLKQIQWRCEQAGVKNPIATIALDGENCWEFFQEDGHIFLDCLYKLLSEDETLNICRVRDYFESLPPNAIQKLDYLHSGSWINSNFHIWIADPVKNAAWMYLKRTRDDLKYYESNGQFTESQLEKAWQEIYIAEGSDWFWWYGEPNSSGQDDIFDMQFRRHLGNIYRILGKEIPNYLDKPLTKTMGRPVVFQTGPISPFITGKEEDGDSWKQAGSFDLSHGAMHRSSRILNKLYFGTDADNCYLRFELNLQALSPFHEIFLYFITPGKTRYNSPIRLKSPSWKVAPVQQYHYAYEVQLSHLVPGGVITSEAEAMGEHLWFNRTGIIKEVAFETVLEVSLSLEQMNTHATESLQFALALVQGGIIEEFQPTNFLLGIERFDPSGAKVHLLGETSESEVMANLF